MDWVCLKSRSPCLSIQLRSCVAHLEKILREKIRDSKYAELRLGAEVTSIEELGREVKVYYGAKEGPRQSVICSFLVGADGKRGYVRKGYLEAKGIRQEVGV